VSLGGHRAALALLKDHVECISVAVVPDIDHRRPATFIVALVQAETQRLVRRARVDPMGLRCAGESFNQLKHRTLFPVMTRSGRPDPFSRRSCTSCATLAAARLALDNEQCEPTQGCNKAKELPPF
jgi:hypothetical protein